VIELVRRLVDQVKTQMRRTLAEIVRYGNPPVNDLFLGISFRVVFIRVSLISDNRDHAILLASFHQLTQMDQSGFCRLVGDTDPHMANPFRAKIAYHQRVELAYPALGTRPIDV